VCVVIDADLQHDERIIPKMFEAVRSGQADVAIGTRYGGGGSVGSWSAGRVKISSVATRIVQRLGLADVSDPMTGFFAIRPSAVVAIAPNLCSFGFKILLDLLVSSPTKLKVVEIPYEFRKRTEGESKLDSTVAVEFGLLLLDKLVGRWVSPRLILFGAVGSFGVLLHLSILKLFLAVGVVFSAAQTVAVMITIAANFLLNNLLTYRDRRLKGAALVRGLASFYLVCGLGAIANVGVGSVAFENHYAWWLAGLAGAIVGSLWNYLASAAVTWKRR
jgi:dolichol-phosphate mannosyltransferase